tara:strand:- start:18411 stop:18668 length:258 start_codon:yes stop_codon:yes gene_type:complete
MNTTTKPQPRIVRAYYVARYRLAAWIASWAFVQLVTDLAIEKVTEDQDDRIVECEEAIEQWDDRLTAVEELAEANDRTLDEMANG